MLVETQRWFMDWRSLCVSATIWPNWEGRLPSRPHPEPNKNGGLEAAAPSQSSRPKISDGEVNSMKKSPLKKVEQTEWNTEELISSDKKFVWHPFTDMSQWCAPEHKPLV